MLQKTAIQDLLLSLQAQLPLKNQGLSHTNGFSQLLEMNESQLNDWLQSLNADQNLTLEGQAVADDLAKTFLLMPDSEINRDEISGLNFLQSILKDPENYPESLTAEGFPDAIVPTPFEDQVNIDVSKVQIVSDTPLPSGPLAMHSIENQAVVTNHSALPNLADPIKPWAQITEASSDNARSTINLNEKVGSMPASTVVDLDFDSNSFFSKESILQQAVLKSALEFTPNLTLDQSGSRAQTIEQFNQNLAQVSLALSNVLPTSETAAPVQQTAPNPLVTVQNPAWSEQIGQQAKWMMRENRKEMEIRLDPPELGSLKVQIKVENGQTLVQIVTATPEARELLDSAQMRLREMLQSQGDASNQVDVQVRQDASDSGQTFEQAEFQDSDGEEQNTPPSDQQQLHRRIQQQQLIDYFI